MNPLLLALVLVHVLDEAPADEPASLPDDVSLEESGEALFAAEQYEAALHVFRQAWTENPRPSLYVHIGRCFQRLGEHELALTAFERYVDAEPLGEHVPIVNELIIEERTHVTVEASDAGTAEVAAAVQEATADAIGPQADAGDTGTPAPVVSEVSAHPALLRASAPPQHGEGPLADDPGAREWLAISGTAVVALAGLTIAAIVVSQPPVPQPNGTIGNFDFRR